MSWHGEVTNGARAVLKHPWTMQDLEEAVKFLRDQGAQPGFQVGVIPSASTGDLALVWKRTEPA